ncbi:hypothetical protein ACHAXT_006404 [Thalassiosira profunda]
MVKLAPALLLAALGAPGEAFAPARPAAVRLASLSMVNDFEKDYDVEVDRRGTIHNIAASGLDRRGALAKAAAATATAASIGMSIIAGGAAWAADRPPTAFSESPTSEASIARMAYDGKKAPAAPAAPAAPSAAAKAAPKAEAKMAKKPADFDGNEAGAVGPTDEGTQAPVKGLKNNYAATRARLDPKTLPPVDLSKVDIATIDPRLLGGVAVVGAAAIAAGASEAANEERVERVKEWSAPVTPEPYGMGGGRNNWDGVDLTAAKNAGMVEAPPKTAPAPPSAPPAAAQQQEKEAWKLDLPTPYGIQNAGGKNPFLKEVEEYCVGGKVTEDCAETIKDYLDIVSNTGAAATSSEVKAIAGYLDSLGSNASPGKRGKAGAAFTSYLDALSEGSAPPPSSAKAVKTYLDTLKGNAPKSGGKEAAVPKKAAAAVLKGGPKTSPPKVGGDISMTKIVKEAQTAAATGTAPRTAGGADMSGFDGRLTTIEGRVTSLETKVDALPEKVFEKIEAWQTGQEERLSGEVKKIIDALSPGPAPAAPAPVVAAPQPVPAPVPAPSGPVVQASPLAGAIPERGFPAAGSGASVKKGYGFGGNASWVTGKSPSAEIATVSSPPPAAAPGFAEEPAVPKKAAAAVLKGGPKTSPPKVGGDISMATIVKEAQTAASPAQAGPVVQANPLAGAVPERGFPQAGSGASGPKGGYGLGGGASWKTGEAKRGSGYLDNMGP